MFRFAFSCVTGQFAACRIHRGWGLAPGSASQRSAETTRSWGRVRSCTPVRLPRDPKPIPDSELAPQRLGHDVRTRRQWWIRNSPKRPSDYCERPGVRVRGGRGRTKKRGGQAAEAASESGSEFPVPALVTACGAIGLLLPAADGHGLLELAAGPSSAVVALARDGGGPVGRAAPGAMRHARRCADEDSGAARRACPPLPLRRPEAAEGAFRGMSPGGGIR